MFVETKETSYEQLEDCIQIMNKKSFGKNPITGYSSAVKKNHQKGDATTKAILKKYGITTLYELNKQQMDQEIILIHKSAIKH